MTSLGTRQLLRQKAHSEEEVSRLDSGYSNGDSVGLYSGSIPSFGHGSFEKYSQGRSWGTSPPILLEPPRDMATERQISQASSGYGEGEDQCFPTNGSREDSRDWCSIRSLSVERQNSQASSGYGEEYRYLSAAARRKCLRSDKSDGKDSIEGKTSRDWGSQDIDDFNSSTGSSVFRKSQEKPKWEEDVEALQRELLVVHIEKIDSISELFQERPQLRTDRNNNSKENSSGVRRDRVPSNPMPLNYLSDIELQISKSNGDEESYVTGPDFDENMHLLPGRDDHASLMQAPNLLSSALHQGCPHYLEWAHFCGGRCSGGLVRSCSSPDCVEGKCLLTWLDKCFHLGHLPDCILCESTLHKILSHNTNCPESNCSLPFCQVVRGRHRHLGRQPSVEELKGEVSSFGKLSAMEALSSSIHSIPDKPNHSEALPLAFLGKFGKFNVLLARLGSPCNYPSQVSTVIIKKVSRRDRLLPALKAIRNLNYDCLSRVKYFAEEESHIIILSEFVPGMTFQEMLVQRGDHWAWQTHYITVIDAVIYLHQHNILFLNWECENVLLKTDELLIGQGSASPRLLMTQQSLSLMPEGANSFQADETLMRAVSPRVAAPEILGLREVSFSADVWGLGVLLYQLIVKQKPYNKLRHHTWSQTREKILQDRLLPDLEGSDSTGKCYREVLRQSLLWSPEDRPSLGTLKQMFINSWRAGTEP